MSKQIKKAVFPVGGLGTRFLPATKAMPKEMLPIVDKPLIQYAFEEAQAAGIEQFIFITGRNKNIISNHFDHVYELQKVLSDSEKTDLLKITSDWLPEAGNVAFVRQQKPMGLGHAVLCAKNFIGNEPFAVLLADETFVSNQPLLKSMVGDYVKKGGNVVAVDEIEIENSYKYGIADIEDKSSLKIKGMVEKPKPEDAPSNLALVGRYILQPEIFDYLEKTKKGSGGEIQLTDAMSDMLSSSDYYAHKFDGDRYDCGTQRGYLQANIGFALERDDLRESTIETIKKFAAEL